MGCGLLGRTAGIALLCALLVAIVAVSCALAIRDLRERRLPNGLVALLALLCLGWAFALAPGTPQLGESIAWGAGVALVLGLLELAWRALLHRHGVGAGDIKVLAAFAIALRQDALALLVVACAAAVVVEVARRHEAFAFGPYLCACGDLFLVVGLVTLAFA